ncbi:MAG: HPr family phosphocarrier protein [Symbiobacteriia bacterium]
MITLSLLVENKSGLHARPGALFVQSAKKFMSRITVRKDNKRADGKSIISLMALGAGVGSQVTIEIDGLDETEAAAAVQKLFADRFGE